MDGGSSKYLGRNKEGEGWGGSAVPRKGFGLEVRGDEFRKVPRWVRPVSFVPRQSTWHREVREKTAGAGSGV